MKTSEQILKIKLNDKQKKIRYIDGLYPDYKNEIITQAEYKRYKEQAADYICEKYSWDKVVDETINLY